MVQVRPFRAEELPGIIGQAVQTALAQISAREWSGASREGALRQVNRMYQNALGVPGTIILVVDGPDTSLGGAPSAYLCAMPQENPFTSERELILLDIFTHPTLRGQGVAQALIAQAEAHARAIGCHGLVAQVALHNQASLRLVSAAGFSPERVIMGRRL